LLSNLAGDNTLYEAFRQNRGEITELFTISQDGKRATEMRFAVEMLIKKDVTDQLGVDAEVSATRLHYEVEIERKSVQGFERLFVKHESLRAIIEDNDEWYKDIPARNRQYWIRRGRRSPYISTDNKNIYKHQEGQKGGKQQTPLGRIERTILSTINSVSFPTAYAARQEMLSWQFFQLEPVKLRNPSGIYVPTMLSKDGSNLAAVLQRMTREDEFVLMDVSRDMANLVPGIRKIQVKTLPEKEEFLIQAETLDENVFSSRVLSDGTLRLMALVILKNDPSHAGVLCLEEPENGVNPSRLKKIVNVLRDIATDFNDDTQNDTVPRQVLVSTHSPGLISLVEKTSIRFMYMTNLMPRHTQVGSVTDEIFADNNNDLTIKNFTRYEIEQYLDASAYVNKLEELTAL
jgi:predicted ATPase